LSFVHINNKIDSEQDSRIDNLIKTSKNFKIMRNNYFDSNDLEN
jgi:hypothetical protein